MIRRSRAAVAIAVASVLVMAAGIATAGVRGWSVSSGAQVEQRAAPSYAALVDEALLRRISAVPPTLHPAGRTFTLSIGQVNKNFVNGNSQLDIDGFVGAVGRRFTTGPRRHRLIVGIELWRFATPVGAQTFAHDEGDHTTTRLGSAWARKFNYPPASNGEGLVGLGVDQVGNYFSLAFDARGTLFVQTRCFSPTPITRAMVERYERIALRATASAGEKSPNLPKSTVRTG